MKPVKRTETDSWYSGYGADNYVYHAIRGEKGFLGGAFEVRSQEDLERYPMPPDGSSINMKLTRY